MQTIPSYAEYMKRTRDIKNDKAEQDTTSDQKVIETQDQVEAVEGIRRGLESMKRKAGRPAKEFFREFFREKRISERK
jgi:hypothetical protein